LEAVHNSSVASRSRYPVKDIPNLLAPAAQHKPHISELNDVLLLLVNALDLVIVWIFFWISFVIHDADARSTYRECNRPCNSSKEIRAGEITSEEYESDGPSSCEMRM